MEANSISPKASGRAGRRARGNVSRLTPRRRAYALLGLVMVAFLVFEAVKHGWVAAAFILVFLALPDVALIGGFKRDLAPGQLAARNVRAYNMLHRYWPAAVLIGLAFVPWLPELWLNPGLEVFLAGFAWATHITVDRAFGFGLRDDDGHQRS